MKYNNITPAKFISRPNRFIAMVETENGIETVHVKNTGRCRELLTEGATVYLERSSNPERKTKYDLIAVEKTTTSGRSLLVNMDSQIPNDVVAEWLPNSRLFPCGSTIKREVFFENSRFDFCINTNVKTAYLEVKGVTLEQNGTALFPDAPTLRGVKHIEELIKCVENGMDAYIVFIIQMKGISKFKPNDEMHPRFGKALRNAQKAGVKIMAFDCDVTPDTITVSSEIPVIL